MKVVFIRANPKYMPLVMSKYDDNGFNDSYYFQGTGSKATTIFYVTHGSPDGYLVLNGDKEEATYSKKEFSFYMNGLLEYSDLAENITEIVTLECFGGYHVPAKLNLCGREVEMKPLGNQKAELWGGWHKIHDDFYFCAMIASKEELKIIGNDISGYVSISPKSDENLRKIEAIPYINQRRFVSSLFDKIIKSNNNIGDYFEKEYEYEKV